MANIVFMAGHAKGSKHNRGFKTVNGRRNNEGDNNIRFEKKLRDYMNKTYKGNFKAFMNTNNPNTDYSLAYRAQQGKGQDVYFSIHSNFSEVSTVSGVEILYSYQGLKYYNFASDVSKTIAKTLNIPNRGVKFRNRNTGAWESRSAAKSYKNNYYGELYNNKAKAAMIVEMFFHSNTEDIKKFYKNEDKLIRELGKVFEKHFKLVKKSKGSNTTNNTFKPHLVRITSPKLRIRESATTKSAIKGYVKKGEVYTIVDKKGNFGKLKSGAGWIGLKYTEPVNGKNTNLKKGDYVKITGNKYYTGETIPKWVKDNKYKIKEVRTNYYLIDTINSKVRKGDVIKYG